jgi:muramidase (phage lysozyme)
VSNLKAFLDMVAWSEIGQKLLQVSDDGYNVCVGSTPEKPILFADYTEHPMRRDAKLNSDAAGRYQFLGRYWLHYKTYLGLPDFSPASQDKWARWLIHECKALEDVEAGRVVAAIYKCNSRWASFPQAGYGQRENSVKDLVEVYKQAGGIVA